MVIIFPGSNYVEVNKFPKPRYELSPKLVNIIRVTWIHYGQVCSRLMNFTEMRLLGRVVLLIVNDNLIHRHDI